MTAPHIHNRYRTVPASLLLETLGSSLETIKTEDGATDADLGAVLGKHEDTAARYRTALGEMGVVSFLRGCREWDGRFANDVMGLVGMRISPIDAAGACEGRTALKALADLMSKKAAALENDNIVDDEELDGMWPEIEAVSRHIDRLPEQRAKFQRRLPALT